MAVPRRHHVRNRLLEDLEAGRTSLGLWVNSVDMVDLCGYVGFSWVMIDQMFSSHDWHQTSALITAAEAAEITPVVRIQSNPWLGYDHRIAADVARAIGVGAQFMLVSNSGKQEIDECVVAARDWHRKGLVIHRGREHGDDDQATAPRRRAFVIPQPETLGALDSLEAVIADPEISIVFIAMSDASRILSGEEKPDFYNARLWEYVDRAVELGRQHGVTIGANTSYAYTLDEMRKRVVMLHERGIRMIMMQGVNFIFQIVAEQLLGELRPLLGTS
jgi:4-hydroxy-2-oxoheptanedioate aldolase